MMGFKKLEEILKNLQLITVDSHENSVSAEGEYTGEAIKALEQWHAAENYFNSIDDPDLIEYALYEVEAARRKYEYLMRKLRSGDAAWEQGIST